MVCVSAARGLFAQDLPTAPAFAKDEHNGQWTMPGRDDALTRYSGLDQINRDNIKTLKAAFTDGKIFKGGTLYVFALP